jgi:hypothetical protein
MHGLKQTAQKLRNSTNPKAKAILAKVTRLMDIKKQKSGDLVGTRKEREANDARRAAARPTQGSANYNHKSSDDENENRNKEVSSGVSRSDDNDKKPSKNDNQPSIRQRAHVATKGMKVARSAGKGARKIGEDATKENEQMEQTNDNSYNYVDHVLNGDAVNFGSQIKASLDSRVANTLETIKNSIIQPNQESEQQNEETTEMISQLLEAIESMSDEQLQEYVDSLNEEEFEEFDKLVSEFYGEDSNEESEETK